jgi:hypothetical protein
LHGHANEVPQLDQFRLPWMLGGQLVQGFINSEELVVWYWARQVNLFNVHPLLLAAMPNGTPAAGFVN